MSHFIKSLKTRIQELTASIEAQKVELTSYEQLLQIEVARSNGATEASASKAPTAAKASASQVGLVAPAVELADIKVTGNKTTLVADVVMAHGKLGASPKDVDQFFSARKIKRSKNLIYNTLSYLVSRKKLQRRDGRYFGVVGAAIAEKPVATPTKRRLSAAGLKRIREAVKKRWAAKRAADKLAGK
jgi:hypothetical protein